MILKEGNSRYTFSLEVSLAHSPLTRTYPFFLITEIMAIPQSVSEHYQEKNPTVLEDRL